MMSGPITVFEVPSDARLPTVSRVMHLRARGHGGLSVRPSKDHELHFVSRGHLKLELEGAEVVLKAGQILYTGPPTRYGVSGDVPSDLSCFHCHFELTGSRVTQTDISTWAEQAPTADASAAGRERQLCLPRVWSIRDHVALTEQFLALMTDQRARHPGDAVAAQARFLLLLRFVARDAVQSLTPRPSSAMSTSRTHVTRAINLIERDLQRRQTLSGIAKVLGIEPEHLARLFKSQVGCSLGSYVVRRSMARAQERLLAETTSVREIGSSLGYLDALYFSRVFKREVGCSPREFRNQTLR